MYEMDTGYLILIPYSIQNRFILPLYNVRSFFLKWQINVNRKSRTFLLISYLTLHFMLCFS